MVAAITTAPAPLTSIATTITRTTVIAHAAIVIARIVARAPVTIAGAIATTIRAHGRTMPAMTITAVTAATGATGIMIPPAARIHLQATRSRNRPSRRAP